MLETMRADRLLRMLMLLQRHRRLTAARLAAELEVSERTVLRDMQALSTAGVPVYTERGNGGGCVLLDDFTTRASGLTPTETQALFAWAGRESTAQLGLGADLSSALAKVAATAPSAAVEGAEALGDVVLADRRRWFASSDDVPWLPELRRAASEGLRIRVRYRSASAAQAGIRTLHPIGLVDHSGRWYLVAEHRRRVRSYRVSRMESVQSLATPVDLADTRPLAVLWSELRSGLEGWLRPIDVEVTVDRGAAADLRRLLSMQLAPGSGIATAPDPDDPDREVWRLAVRQPDVLAAVAVLKAPDLTVRAPASLLPLIRSAAARALAHYDPG